ncbi:hypothetical protein ABK040_016610 [Willaertia magna]
MPLDFHNKIKFNMLNSNNTSEETIEETVKVVVQSNIDSSCVDNKIIKRSNVLRFKVYLSQLDKTLQQSNNNTINNNNISLEVNRYYCLIHFINPKSNEILKNQEGNSLLNKETMSIMTKEEDKLCGNLNVGINKTNRGTLVKLEIIICDRITNENIITLQSEETFLILDRDTKKRKDKPRVSNNSKETKKVKQQDSNDENKENLFPQLLNCKKEEMNNIFDSLDQLKVTDLYTFETLDDHFPYFEDDSLFDLLNNNNGFEKFEEDLKKTRRSFQTDETLKKKNKIKRDLIIQTARKKKLLSIETNPPIDKVIDSGAVAHFIKFLDIKNILQFVNISPLPVINDKDFVYYHSELKPTVNLGLINNLRFEATWALTNIASGSSAHTNFIVTYGAVPYFIELIGDCAAIRDYVLSMGVMKVLINDTWPLAKHRISMTRNFSWTLSNCLRGKPSPDWELVKDCYPLLCELIYNSDEAVLTDCCWALSYMADTTNGLTEIARNRTLLKRLVELCLHHQPVIITPALRTIGNVATGNDTETQSLIDVGALTVLTSCLSRKKKSIRKEAAWTISNITAGDASLVNQVLNSGIFNVVMERLHNDEFDVSKECIWIVSNALIGCNFEDAKRLVFDYDAIRGFSKFLDKEDTKAVLVSLEGLENIYKAYSHKEENDKEYLALLERMEDNNIPDALERLQSHKDDSVASLAYNIIEKYFAEEEDEKEDTKMIISE